MKGKSNNVVRRVQPPRRCKIPRSYNYTRSKRPKKVQVSIDNKVVAAPPPPPPPTVLPAPPPPPLAFRPAPPPPPPLAFRPAPPPPPPMAFRSPPPPLAFRPPPPPEFSSTPTAQPRRQSGWDVLPGHIYRPYGIYSIFFAPQRVSSDWAYQPWARSTPPPPPPPPQGPNYRGPN